MYAGETNSLINPTAYHDEYAGARRVDWTEPGLRITRFRLVSDPGFPYWDVSYCHGRLGDEPVSVILPFDQLPKRYAAFLIHELNKAGLNGKRLGIWDARSTLI